MSVRNQNRYSPPRRNNGLIFIRNAFLFMLLLFGCFVLGFKVLAPLLPTGQKSNKVNADGALAAPSGDDNSVDSAAQTAPVPQVQSPAPTKPTIARRTTVSTRNDDTAIEPADPSSVQAPDKLEGRSTSGNLGASGDTGAAADASTDPTPGGAALTGRRHGDRLAAAENTNATTPAPASSENTDPLQSTDDVNDQHGAVGAAAPQDAVLPHKGVYRVQIGVFTTRDKADTEAKRAQDQSLDATVIPIRRHGRTLYRVQHAVYQHRENAEAARERLVKAGFDASIN